MKVTASTMLIIEFLTLNYTKCSLILKFYQQPIKHLLL